MLFDNQAIDYLILGPSLPSSQSVQQDNNRGQVNTDPIYMQWFLPIKHAFLPYRYQNSQPSTVQSRQEKSMTATRDQNHSLYLEFGPHLTGKGIPSYWCATSKAHSSPCMNRPPPLRRNKTTRNVARALSLSSTPVCFRFLFRGFGAGEPNDPPLAHKLRPFSSPHSLLFSSLSLSRLFLSPSLLPS